MFISLSGTSGFVTIVSERFADSVKFDARVLLPDISDEIRRLTTEHNGYRRTVLSASLNLKKRNGTVFVYGITGSAFSSRIPLRPK